MRRIISHRKMNVLRGISSEAGGTDKIIKSKKTDELVFALRKREGEGLEDSDASDTAFTIQSLMLKRDERRFSIRMKKKSRDIMLPGDSDDPSTVTLEKEEKAPQHRRYLSFPKVANEGTPTQRQKWDNKMRLARGASVAHKYNLEKLGFQDMEEDERELSLGGSDPVEDKIMLSILQGDFDNLERAGKPFEEHRNGLVDRTTDLGMSVLAKNGVLPDWIEYQKVMTAHNRWINATIQCSLCDYLLKQSKKKENQNQGRNNFIETIDGLNTLRIEIIQFFMEEEIRAAHYVTDKYNLSCPAHGLTRGRLLLEDSSKNIMKQVAESSYGSDSTGLMSLMQDAQHVLVETAPLRTMSLDDYRNSQGIQKNNNNITRPDYIGRVSSTSEMAWRGAVYTNREKRQGLGTLAMVCLLAPVDGFAKWLQGTLNKIV